MDHFGIGAGVLGSVRCYFVGARRTGRTTSLVESVKNGDRVIFASPNEAETFRRLALERGVRVDCVTIEPRSLELQGLGSSPDDGRTIFDRGWIEAYYEQELLSVRRVIDELEKRLSGFGADHRSTQRKAKEIARWGQLGHETNAQNRRKSSASKPDGQPIGAYLHKKSGSTRPT